MLSDRETTLDALGFQPYVDSLYAIIVSPGITPFTIGIYGKWGTGKTSLMRMLQEKLDKEENIKTIWFNAYKFENMRKFLRFLVVSQYVDDEKDMKDITEKIHGLRVDRFDLEVRSNRIRNMNKKQLEECKDIMEQQEIINENDHNS
jgi:predicted KAP-like P-loop ATPase